MKNGHDFLANKNGGGGGYCYILRYICCFSYVVDTNIRAGLYHEFKKHGDVGQIKVLGRENNRYAILYFRR